MKTYTLETVVSVARSLSPFYRQLYSEVQGPSTSLDKLPLISSSDFWDACTPRDNQVMTGPVSDGIVFKSGGTTGNPKFSIYSRVEWEAMTGYFGRFQERNQFLSGDQVANLFYAGELYSSFLFLHDSMRACPVNVTLFPLSGKAPHDYTVSTIQEFDINVFLGVPTTIMSFCEYVHHNQIGTLPVERIYFGGESMYADQKAFIKSVFPGVDIRSVGYASVDGGLLGFFDDSCGYNEHRMFDGYNIIEIIDDETGQPICEEGREGSIYTTNLSRLLMPIIRYPVGDRGVWTEPVGSQYRRFQVRGRTEAGARIGTVTFYIEDLRNIISKIDSVHIFDFQLIVDHDDGKDRLTICLGVDDPQSVPADMSDRIVDLIYKERPQFVSEINGNHLHPITIRWTTLNELSTNVRTGKLKRLIDQRFQGGE